jgi:hypothetical protein
MHQHAFHTLFRAIPPLQPRTANQTPQKHGSIVTSSQYNRGIIHNTSIEIIHTTTVSNQLPNLVSYASAPQPDTLVLTARDQPLIVEEVALDNPASVTAAQRIRLHVSTAGSNENLPVAVKKYNPARC